MNFNFKTISDVDYLLDMERGFVLFFRPRCGSTTVTRWFFENQGVKFGGFSISAFRNEWLEPRLERMNDFLVKNYDALHKFAVVRDPVDRAVSSFLHVVNHQHDGQFNLVKPYIKRSLSKHDLTFEDWLHYLQQIDLNKSHILWRRQSALSCWSGGVNDIVLVEKLNDYLSQMNQKFNLSAAPTFNSVTIAPEEKKTIKEKWHFKAKYFGNKPFKELLKFKENGKFRNFPHYSQFYNQSNKTLIQKLYYEDAAIFESAIAEIG